MGTVSGIPRWMIPNLLDSTRPGERLHFAMERSTHFLMGKSTINGDFLWENHHFLGKIHYFYGHFQLQTVKSPEGRQPSEEIPLRPPPLGASA